MLWQQNQSLSLISVANSQVKLEKSSQLPPINNMSFISSLSNIPWKGPPPISKQEIYIIQ